MVSSRVINARSRFESLSCFRMESTRLCVSWPFFRESAIFSDFTLIMSAIKARATPDSSLPAISILSQRSFSLGGSAIRLDYQVCPTSREERDKVDNSSVVSSAVVPALVFATLLAAQQKPDIRVDVDL